VDGQVASLEQGLEEALQSSKKTKGRRNVGVDFAAVADLTMFLCCKLNEGGEAQPIMELIDEFLLKLSCKRAATRGIQEFSIVFNCRSPTSALEEALASAHSAALRLYDKATESNSFASDFRDSLRTDLMQHGCGIRVREGALVASTTRSKFVSMWTSIGAADEGGEEAAAKTSLAILRLRGLAKLFLETYPQCEQEQNEDMLKAYVARGTEAPAVAVFHVRLNFVLGAMDFLVRSEALEHLASALENDADAELRSRNQDRRASLGSLPPPVRAAVAGDAAASGDVGATPLKFTILEAEIENLNEQLLREQRKSARYEKQIESIIIQHNEEIIKLNMQAEELKGQLAHTHRRLARFQEKLSASEEGQLIKAMHAKEQMIEALQVRRLVGL
jgi:hypothetical protein